MSDFYQNGIISTLHNLRTRTVEDLENDLIAFSKTRPMALVLPSLFSELEKPALQLIINELKKVDYLDSIIIGLDQATKEEYKYALHFFKQLPQKHRVLWNDGPRLKKLDDRLKTFGLSPKELGKGRNVWFCFGYVLAEDKVKSVALHDCDITTYDRELLARLIYPVANPNFNYQFCKGFYSRVTNEKMNGRVCRLLVTPLIRSLKKIFKDNDYLNYLDSFRYALAGEFSMRTDVLNDIRIPSDWGLEIGVLSEVNRNFSNNHLCQVDITDHYDHKHQDLSLDDKNKGLSKMSIDICKSIFRKLATNGHVFDNETFRSIKATYYRIALDFIETYNNDALMNGLSFDIHSEEKAVEMFAQNILDAGNSYLDNPMETPFIPSWTRVNSAIPNFQREFLEAVDGDMDEFSKR
jgi:glucosyl-3-phosphoglycerate synthase